MSPQSYLVDAREYGEEMEFRGIENAVPTFIDAAVAAPEVFDAFADAFAAAGRGGRRSSDTEAGEAATAASAADGALAGFGEGGEVEAEERHVDVEGVVLSLG